jgi:hypothetical protein
VKIFSPDGGKKITHKSDLRRRSKGEICKEVPENFLFGYGKINRACTQKIKIYRETGSIESNKFKVAYKTAYFF